jgi:hypothetical protein
MKNEKFGVFCAFALAIQSVLPNLTFAVGSGGLSTQFISARSMGLANALALMKISPLLLTKTSPPEIPRLN